jgi:hypothetical protein
LKTINFNYLIMTTHSCEKCGELRSAPKPEFHKSNCPLLRAKNFTPRTTPQNPDRVQAAIESKGSIVKKRMISNHHNVDNVKIVCMVENYGRNDCDINKFI